MSATNITVVFSIDGTLQIIGFPFFESQAIWIAQVLSGRKALPSWEEMMKSIKEFYHSREVAGIPKHCTHDIANFEVINKIKQKKPIIIYYSTKNEFC